MRVIRAVKVVLFLACLIPAVLLALKLRNPIELGPNPVEMLEHTTGDWAIWFLLITLSITPLRKLTNFPKLILFRRMLGLFAFFYVLSHFTIFLYYDNALDWPALVKDLTKRPFIIAGFTAFVLLIPLAITSTAGWIRRLGGKNWQRLHRLVYVAALGGIIHYYWLVKSDVREPLLYGGIWAVLMLFRLGTSIAKRMKRSPAPVRAA
jgi:sulfoxide reductase heme-binding subunit YedZ